MVRLLALLKNITHHGAIKQELGLSNLFSAKLPVAKKKTYIVEI